MYENVSAAPRLLLAICNRDEGDPLLLAASSVAAHADNIRGPGLPLAVSAAVFIVLARRTAATRVRALLWLVCHSSSTSEDGSPLLR
jgi:hypothetical protein